MEANQAFIHYGPVIGFTFTHIILLKAVPSDVVNEIAWRLCLFLETVLSNINNVGVIFQSILAQSGCELTS